MCTFVNSQKSGIRMHPWACQPAQVNPCRPLLRPFTSQLAGPRGTSVCVELRKNVVTMATAGTSAVLPATQQEAVQDAVGCVASRLTPRLKAIKGPSKGFSSQAAPIKETLHIEIPTADQSPKAIAQLAVDTAATLGSALGSLASPMVIVCAEAAVASAVSSMKGRPLGTRVMELKEACRITSLEGAVLLLISPSISDVALCQQLTDETWSGKAVVMVNAAFLADSPAALNLPVELSSYADKVFTAYCLMPVAVKGLLGNKEGVVLRKLSGRNNDPGLWRILIKAPGDNDQYLQIGQSKRRPNGDDLQAAFINANAANSPLTKLVSKIKGK